MEDEIWCSKFAESQWHGYFENLLEACVHSQSKQINVVLTNDEAIREINNQYRGINKTTNVLSFPLYTKDEIDLFSADEKVLLGDIIMAYNTIYNEALTFGKTLYERVSHLFVHGVLHTLGYDHMTDSERAAMENLEIQILSLFNIKNPYILGSDNKIYEYI